MKRGAILILVLEVILVISTLTVFFLKNIENELIYTNQILPEHYSQVNIDSILSITITNLYAYLNDFEDLENFYEKINNVVHEKISKDFSVKIVNEDGKIPINIKYIPLLEQLFFLIGCNYEDTQSLIFDLNNFLSKNDDRRNFRIDQLLDEESFKKIFVKKNGFLSKKWRFFLENTTTEEIDAINITETSDAVLHAICLLEGWNFAHLKSVLNENFFLTPLDQSNILANLYAHGLIPQKIPFLKSKSSVFAVKIIDTNDFTAKLFQFLIKINNLHDYNGFPFEIISQTNKF